MQGEVRVRGERVRVKGLKIETMTRGMSDVGRKLGPEKR